MTVTLERLIADGVLSPLQQAFGLMMARNDPGAASSVPLAAALVSEQVARGHVCFDLREATDLVFGSMDEAETTVRYEQWPAADTWLTQLRASSCVLSRDSGDDGQSVDRPLVLDAEHARLYLGRHWFYQQRLGRDIARRIAAPPLPMDEEALAAHIVRLFPDRERESDFDQCMAAANAVDRWFSVITGGPGTGKTTTVAKLIALRLLLHSPGKDGRDLRVLLMAPTGKAAQRLNESLGRAANRLDVDDAIRQRLLTIQAGTIHRQLRWTPLAPERGGPFVHCDEFPLEADVVLVDEASMVDIGLMWRLFSAVPAEAQIILMGDRDQLASVEAGGVLGDLCGGTAGSALRGADAERRAMIARRTGLELPAAKAPLCSLDAAVVPLRYSHRFDPRSSLGKMAAAVRAGRADEVIDQLRSREDPQIQWLTGDSAWETLGTVVRLSVDRYRSYLEMLRDSPSGNLEILKALLQFRVLCAHREGRWGELNLDRAIAEALDRAGVVRLRHRSYLGQAVMVTQNDYRQHLFNGDVGVVVQEPAGGGLAVLFESSAAADGCRRVPAALVPDHRSCFAMTIHKSQGSEFHRVMVVLPPFASPVLTRELLYTGMTRVADSHDPQTGQRQPGTLYIVGSEDVLRETIRRRIRRTSGLRAAIEGAS